MVSFLTPFMVTLGGGRSFTLSFTMLTVVVIPFGLVASVKAVNDLVALSSDKIQKGLKRCA